MDEAQRLPRLYTARFIAHCELMCRLVCLAAERPPEEFSSLLPEWCLRDLREESSNPPSRPEDCPRMFAIVCVANARPGQRPVRAYPVYTQQSWYEGIWRWHRHLWSQPHAS